MPAQRTRSTLMRDFLKATALGLFLSAGSAQAGISAPRFTTPAASPQVTTVIVPVAASQAFNPMAINTDRVVRLTGEINDENAVAVINRLIALSQTPGDIELRINSGGGDVREGLAIYDVMKSIPNDIRTVCEGQAQSMASMLLMAGTPGKRFAYPNCRIMLHMPAGSLSGKVVDVENSVASVFNPDRVRMEEIYAQGTGWSTDTIRAMIRQEFYPSLSEAIQLGFIDGIVPVKRDPAPARPTLPSGFCGVPGRQELQLCVQMRPAQPH